MKKIDKKNIILLSICVAILFVVGCFIYYFLSPKNYKVYIKNETIETYVVAINDNTLGSEDIYIYDKKAIEELLSLIDEVKAWPGGNSLMKGDKTISVTFMCKEGPGFCVSLQDYGEAYKFDICDVYNVDSYADPNFWNMLGGLMICKEDGEKILQGFENIYVENVKDISVADIVDTSQNQNKNWDYYKQFQHSEYEEGTTITKYGEISGKPHKFSIADKKGYVLVWYYECSQIDGTSGEETRISNVWEAKVYDENGQSDDLYANDIEKFLEEMK